MNARMSSGIQLLVIILLVKSSNVESLFLKTKSLIEVSFVFEINMFVNQSDSPEIYFDNLYCAGLVRNY
jgi:hypothetical protein